MGDIYYAGEDAFHGAGLSFRTKLMPKGKFYIIWNPDHHAPPTQTFFSKKEAERVAEDMAKRFKPHRFYVFEAKSKFVVADLPVERSVLK